MNKKILVTGGSGFIPSHLVRRLVKMGSDVYVTVKYNSIIDNIRISDVWDKVSIVEADLRNIDSLEQIKTIKPEIIIHMAAYNHVGDSFIHPNEAMNSNSLGTVNLLESYQDYEQFIYTSTSEVYGYQDSVPFKENMKPSPISPYSIGKYSGELYARMKSDHQNKPITILRPFNAFGPYQSNRAIISEIITKCLNGNKIETTSGEQTREFNYVSNLVDGFIAAIEQRGKSVGKTINLGGGEEIKIKDLVLLIHDLTESKSELDIGKLDHRPTEIWRMYTDANIAREDLNWAPKINFKEGLVRTIKWHKEFLSVFGKSGDLVKICDMA